MFTDFVLNGRGQGPVAQTMENFRFDPGMMQPYVNRRGQRAVTINTGRMVPNKDGTGYEPERREVPISNLLNQGIFSPVFNAGTLLRKEEWIQLDQVVLRAARLRLRAWSDLASRNSFGGFNGMGKMVLEHETMSDPGEAIVDMDGLTEGRADTPLFRLQGIPLPITHGDFWFSSRQLMVSRNTGTPLDTTMAEAAGRRVAEMIEKTLIGVETGYTGSAGPYATGYGYGTGGSSGESATRSCQVYGYTNYPDRLTKTDLTAPTSEGWTPEDTLMDVIAMRQQLIDGRFYGPFMLYHSTDWDYYMDGDYYVAKTTGAVAPTTTLRERLKKLGDIEDVRRLDFLSSSTNPFTLILVQMTPEVCRAINGMDITTMQWESVGGMRVNFKVMAIQVPDLRSDFNGRCGILHATTS
jgi:hypothetical protein